MLTVIIDNKTFCRYAGTEVVVKQISTLGMNDAERQKIRDNFMREAAIMKALR